MRIHIITIGLFILFNNTLYASFPIPSKVESITNTEQVSKLENTTQPRFFSDMHWGGFFLGLLLGWIGLLFAWIFSDDPYFINAVWKGAVLWSLIIWIIGEVLWWGSV
tara:strand:- start:16 stop:339 length:324 start_codon:yes stop_codon:yes gene_type:complete